jgi:peptidoglycan hydrolase-like protein with peptidoglycan-binding domain
MPPPTISEGSNGPTVSWAQYLLTRITLDWNQIDGIFGPVTKNAVEQFQSQSHLGVDGVVGPITWGALKGDSPEPPTLAQGSTGSVVESLQTALNELGANPVLVVDGEFGPNTATAVKGFQQHGRVPTDGVVGLQTWGLPIGAATKALANMCGVTGPGVALEGA